MRPSITITYDPDAQGVRMEWDKDQIKNPVFLAAVLGIAKDHAEMIAKTQMVGQMQARQAEQQAAVELRGKLKI